MNITFKNLTLDEFNDKYGLEATKDMDLHEFTEYIEESDVSYFYASYSKEDIVNAVEEEKETADNLPLEFVCVDAFCLAIY